MGRMGRIAYAFLASWVLVSCGGGGASGASGPGSGSGAVFDARYYPLAAGDRRLYRVTAGTAVGTLRSETVGARAIVAGQSATELRDESGARGYVVATNESITQVAGPTDDVLTQALGSLELVRFGLTAGQSVVLVDRTVRLDVDGDGRQDTVLVRALFTFVGFEDVTTTLSRFTNAAQVRTEGTISVTLASGVRVSSTVDAREWYAGGIGRVRSVSTSVVGTQPADSETEEILSYGVGSLRSDTIAPAIASTSPGEGAIVASAPSFTVRFSERVDPQTLEGAAGLQLVNAAGVALPARRSLSADGLELTLVPDVPLPEGRYTLRTGAGIVDWANNPMTGRELSFTVDFTGPRLVSSVPAAGSDDFATDGKFELTFNEPLTVATDGAGATIEVLDATGFTVLQTLPATISGATLTATVGTQLTRNTDYRVRAAGALSDLAGNQLQSGAATVSFRTDPGPLARPVSLVAGATVMASRLADLDGDGITDIVFAGNDSTGPFVGLRPGLVSGGFGPARSLFSLLDPSTFGCNVLVMVVGDFDGDGRRDIALPCGSFLRVYLQTAAGVFTLERPGFNGAIGLAATDVNGDGRDDLVVLGTPPGADIGSFTAWHVFTRTGPGNWAPLALIPHGSDFAMPVAAVVADLNGDGRSDLLWVQQLAGGLAALAWAPAQGSGFGAIQTVPMPDGLWFTAALALGDLDGDGLADVVFSGVSFTLEAPSVLIVLRGLPGGGFASPLALPSGRLPGTLAVADLNGDGRADILVARRDGTSSVGVLLQQNGGGFDAERGFETSAQDAFSNREMTLVDVNDDGLRDLIIGPDLLLRRPAGQVWPAAASVHAATRLGGATTSRRNALNRAADLILKR